MKRFLLIVSCLLAIQAWSQKEEFIEKLLQGTLRCGTVRKEVRVSSIGCRVTLTENQPSLYVLYGILTDSLAIQKLNPKQIESIQVLKGASASAVYSSRAMEGIFIITQKKVKNTRLVVLDESDSL